LNAASSRKTWQLTKRLTPSQLGTLRTFYFALNGPQQPFYFYDPFETDPHFSYDGTGVVATGRIPSALTHPGSSKRFLRVWKPLLCSSRLPEQPAQYRAP